MLAGAGLLLLLVRRRRRRAAHYAATDAQKALGGPATVVGVVLDVNRLGANTAPSTGTVT